MPRSCKNRPLPTDANPSGALSATAGENVRGAGFCAEGSSPDSHAGRPRLGGRAKVLCLIVLCVLLAFPLMGFMGQGPLGGEQMSTSGSIGASNATNASVLPSVPMNATHPVNSSAAGLPPAGQPAPGHSKRTLERKQAQIDQMNRDLKRQKNSRTSESKVNALQLKISKLEAEIASESTAPVQSSAAEDASDDALRLCLEARASPAASLLANDTEWLLSTPAVQ